MNLVKERYFILCLIIEEYLFIWIYISQHYSFKLLHSVALHCDIGVTLTNLHNLHILKMCDFGGTFKEIRDGRL